MENEDLKMEMIIRGIYQKKRLEKVFKLYLLVISNHSEHGGCACMHSSSGDRRK